MSTSLDHAMKAACHCLKVVEASTRTQSNVVTAMVGGDYRSDSIQRAAAEETLLRQAEELIKSAVYILKGRP